MWSEVGFQQREQHNLIAPGIQKAIGCAIIPGNSIAWLAAKVVALLW